MMHGSILANYIVSAYFRAGQRKGLQGLFTAVLCSVVDDYKIGLTQSKIGSAHPGFGVVDIFNRRLTYNFPKSFCLVLIDLIGCSIFIRRTGVDNSCDNKNVESYSIHIIKINLKITYLKALEPVPDHSLRMRRAPP